MRSDEAGVAGFFEDLPVLMFVLVGTLTLVVSGICASERLSQKKFLDELKEAAGKLADLIVSELLGGNAGPMPIVSSASSINLSRLALDVIGQRAYSVSIEILHPVVEWLCSESVSDQLVPVTAGFASRLLNVLANNGCMAIMEVNVFVW